MSSAVASLRHATRFLVAASLVATLLLAGVEPAAAALPPATPASAPFDVVGVLQAASLDDACASDPHCGGTLTVDDRVVLVPRETVVLLPTSALTWQELFARAPAPYAPSQTGLALCGQPGTRVPLRGARRRQPRGRHQHRRADRHRAGRPGARLRLHRRDRLRDGRASHRRHGGRRRHQGAAERSDGAVRQGALRRSTVHRGSPRAHPSPLPRASPCASRARTRTWPTIPSARRATGLPTSPAGSRSRSR